MTTSGSAQPTPTSRLPAPARWSPRRIAKLDSDLADIRQSVGEDGKFAQECVPVVESIQSLRQAMFIAKDVANASGGPFTSKVNAIDDALAKLRTFVQKPDNWMKQVPGTVAVSAGINRKWQDWVAEVREKLPEMKASGTKFRELKDATDAWRTYLVELDRNFPHVPAELAAPYADRAAKVREQAMIDLVAPFHPSFPLTPPPTQVASEHFQQFGQSLLAMQKEVSAPVGEGASDGQAARRRQRNCGAETTAGAGAGTGRRRGNASNGSRRATACSSRRRASLDKSLPTEALKALDALAKLNAPNPAVPDLLSRARKMRDEQARLRRDCPHDGRSKLGP